jgi:hypothetical protein
LIGYDFTAIRHESEINPLAFIQVAMVFIRDTISHDFHPWYSFDWFGRLSIIRNQLEPRKRTRRAIQPLPAPLSAKFFRGFMASPPFHRWRPLVAVYAL